MSPKSLKLIVEVDVHAVTCPGVWLHCKGEAVLSVCFMGFHIRTRPLPPVFPLLFHDRLVFEKTLPGVSAPVGLQEALSKEVVYLELLQRTSVCTETVLSTFENSALEFLYPCPGVQPPSSCVDLDLLLEPTRDFPGIISPKAEISTRTTIEETRDPHLEQIRDVGVNVSVSELHGTGDCCGKVMPPPPPRRSFSRSKERAPFVWRKVDDDLLKHPPRHRIPIPTTPKIRRTRSSNSVRVNSQRHNHNATSSSGCDEEEVMKPRGRSLHRSALGRKRSVSFGRCRRHSSSSPCCDLPPGDEDFAPHHPTPPPPPPLPPSRPPTPRYRPNSPEAGCDCHTHHRRSHPCCAEEDDPDCFECQPGVCRRGSLHHSPCHRRAKPLCHGSSCRRCSSSSCDLRRTWTCCHNSTDHCHSSPCHSDGECQCCQ